MKKYVLFFATIIFWAANMSFTFNYNESSEPMKNSCTVKVTYGSGSPAKGVKVGYEVGGSMACVGGGTAGYTDSDGEVSVQWSDGCKCTYIYIDGKAHKGPFKDGGYYTFTK